MKGLLLNMIILSKVYTLVKFSLLLMLFTVKFLGVIDPLAVTSVAIPFLKVQALRLQLSFCSNKF